MSAPPDHNKNRETVNLDHCHQTGPVSGGTENVYQNTKCPKCGTQSACRVQTKPFFFGNLGSLGGWTLGIINVQGGIPTPIYLYKDNPGNACYSVLPTAPLEFTVIPKEVKFVTIHKDLRSHQYLDDWLVGARSHQACLQHTQELVNNVSATGLADELTEIRAGAQTRLRFCRLPVCLPV